MNGCMDEKEIPIASVLQCDIIVPWRTMLFAWLAKQNKTKQSQQQAQIRGDSFQVNSTNQYVK